MKSTNDPKVTKTGENDKEMAENYQLMLEDGNEQTTNNRPESGGKNNNASNEWLRKKSMSQEGIMEMDNKGQLREVRKIRILVT